MTEVYLSFTNTKKDASPKSNVLIQLQKWMNAASQLNLTPTFFNHTYTISRTFLPHSSAHFWEETAQSNAQCTFRNTIVKYVNEYTYIYARKGAPRVGIGGEVNLSQGKQSPNSISCRKVTKPYNDSKKHKLGQLYTSLYSICHCRMAIDLIKVWCRMLVIHIGVWFVYCMTNSLTEPCWILGSFKAGKVLYISPPPAWKKINS